ncbi:MAG: TlpA family protein disulfide reductase [Sandaracinus sp.]|nr:TlpA family protein disulfide reductase [Sandaracinus sp.]MCB9623235.1 TlpA family protein disulfide reductase [Sandaracinus sp.]MCB9633720.1 TlpA family protein disulfide reductase [Sandaracinus sp.]
MRSSLVALACLLASVAFAAPTTPAGPQGAVVGEIAPSLDGQRVSGSAPVNLDQLRGRVVILDFWATWCGPCAFVMPQLDQLQRAHEGEGLTVIGLSDELPDQVRRHLRARPVGFTIASAAGTTWQRYGVRGIPTMVLVDRAGKVRLVESGADLTRVRATLRQLLDERP